MQKSNFFPRKATFHSRRHDNYGSLLAKGRRRMQATVVYDRNHLFGLGSDTETETENWPKL